MSNEYISPALIKSTKHVVRNIEQLVKQHISNFLGVASKRGIKLPFNRIAMIPKIEITANFNTEGSKSHARADVVWTIVFKQNLLAVGQKKSDKYEIRFDDDKSMQFLHSTEKYPADNIIVADVLFSMLTWLDKYIDTGIDAYQPVDKFLSSSFPRFMQAFLACDLCNEYLMGVYGDKSPFYEMKLDKMNQPAFYHTAHYLVDNVATHDFGKVLYDLSKLSLYNDLTALIFLRDHPFRPFDVYCTHRYFSSVWTSIKSIPDETDVTFLRNFVDRIRDNSDEKRVYVYEDVDGIFVHVRSANLDLSFLKRNGRIYKVKTDVQVGFVSRAKFLQELSASL